MPVSIPVLDTGTKVHVHLRQVGEKFEKLIDDQFDRYASSPAFGLAQPFSDAYPVHNDSLSVSVVCLSVVVHSVALMPSVPSTVRCDFHLPPTSPHHSVQYGQGRFSLTVEIFSQDSRNNLRGTPSGESKQGEATSKTYEKHLRHRSDAWESQPTNES